MSKKEQCLKRKNRDGAASELELGDDVSKESKLRARESERKEMGKRERWK